MFSRRKNKNKNKTKSISSKHTIASSVSSGPSHAQSFSDNTTLPEPQHSLTEHASRSLLSLPGSTSNTRLSNTFSRQSISSPDTGRHTFTFDAPRSLSYTSSPISPVAPILPAIPCVSAHHFIRETSHDDTKAELWLSSDSWLGSLRSSLQKVSQGDSAAGASGSETPLSSVPNQGYFRSGVETIRDSPRIDSNNLLFEDEEATQWPLAPNVLANLDIRPSTAPHKDPNQATRNNDRPRFTARFTRDGRPMSANFSRPHTAGSARRSIMPDLEQNSTNDSAHMHGASSSMSSTVIREPVDRNHATSPSRFPTQGHRPSPRPPGSSSSGSIPSLSMYTNSNNSFVQTYTPVGPVSSSQAAPTAPTTKTKHKLSSLNPVSLLLRRRSKAPIEPLSEESLMTPSNTTTLPPLPRDFDPRIRGSIVHDFSTPKDSKKNAFSPASYRSSIVKEQEAFEKSRPEREHSAVFTENFDDATTNNEAAIRAEQLENSDFIARNLPRSEPDMPPPLPPFGRPMSKALTIDTTVASAEKTQAKDNSSLTPVVEDAVAVANSGSNRQSTIQRRTSNNADGVYRRSAASRVSRKSIISGSNVGSDASYSMTRIPSHNNSMSSRFSFQLAGSDSVLQEQMLEERHKQKEAAKRLAEEQNPSKQAEVADVEDEDDFDFDEDMEYEEDIPIVGDDWSYNDKDTCRNVGLGSMTLDDMQRDAGGGIVKLALNEHSGRTDNENLSAPAVQGLGIHSMPEEQAAQTNDSPDAHIHQSPATSMQDSIPFDFTAGEDPDDLYYDDGLIDEVNYDETERFDESNFDDPSHPLYERKPKEPPLEGNQTSGVPNDDDDDEESFDNSTFESNIKVIAYGGQHASIGPISHELYASMLEQAAAKAAANGRFDRLDNIDDTQSATADTTREPSSQPSLVQDDSHSSPVSQSSPIADCKAAQPEEVSPSRSSDAIAGFTVSHEVETYASNYMGFASDLDDYDSAMEDDEYIKAANADALASDEEGVYGTEFGFYPRANDGEEGDYQNGGYFGPRDWSDIKRQRSTREPNLTPITERSEYSARNSFINLQSMDKDRIQPSPGLAQLRRSPGTMDNDDMNFEALARLRKHAFGSSQASLGSIGSSRDVPSSPLASSPIVAMRESRNAAAAPTQITTTNARTSVGEEWEDAESESDWTSTEEFEDDEFGYNDGFEAPTVSQAMINSIAFSTLGSSGQERLESSVASEAQFHFPYSFPLPGGVAAPAKRSAHSRSGSDTVTYVQEQDAGESQPHWVLERRRTGDDGLEEVVERTRIANGTI